MHRSRLTTLAPHRSHRHARGHRTPSVVGLETRRAFPMQFSPPAGQTHMVTGRQASAIDKAFSSGHCCCHLFLLCLSCTCNAPRTGCHTTVHSHLHILQQCEDAGVGADQPSAFVRGTHCPALRSNGPLGLDNSDCFWRAARHMPRWCCRSGVVDFHFILEWTGLRKVYAQRLLTTSRSGKR